MCTSYDAIYTRAVYCVLHLCLNSMSWVNPVCSEFVSVNNAIETAPLWRHVWRCRIIMVFIVIMMIIISQILVRGLHQLAASQVIGWENQL